MAPLGIIAGLGDLPLAIADNAVASGQGVYVLRVKGFEEPALSKFPGDVIGLGEVGGVLKRLKAAGCKDVVFAGIVNRPNFSDLKLDMKGMALLPKVLSAARQGDDALLRVLVNEFEKQGFNVLGSHEVNGQLLAPAGLIAGNDPRPEDMADIEHAARVVAATGALDIGQGAVVCDGLVLAVEAQEGTDAMLDRCARLPATIRGTETQRRGVLVKRPKPGQELRIDLPTTGVSTVEKVAAAGLAGLAVEAKGALLLNKSAMKEAAERLGVFIYGFPPELWL
ncbi:MAG: UDP-2,3-diacylglucosamine diphosphatase LpxI [Alphaproteobacteria bacterium]|nr:UDP-2,3-diacylglucosamine pyrophosphatase [Hyphomonas sp.]MBR9805643.1 UDP-2,3-diacylglucosamine diphosphatase LpxI [Alphaproteobacteria bacterium]|tara:strand:+ start:5269 stop:6111 length:843 start_codon:yes stop_codon:yes gene_type:complete